MSRLFLDPLRSALPGMLCTISPVLCAASLHPQAPGMLVQAAVAPGLAPPSVFGEASKSAMRDAAR
jgi:hypothetical protein